MEQKFIAAWMAAREKAAGLGVRLRPITEASAMSAAHRSLTGTRVSEGFQDLMMLGRLELSLEALVIRAEFGALFSDEEANLALSRLLEGGYRF